MVTDSTSWEDKLPLQWQQQPSHASSDYSIGVKEMLQFFYKQLCIIRNHGSNIPLALFILLMHISAFVYQAVAETPPMEVAHSISLYSNHEFEICVYFC